MRINKVIIICFVFLISLATSALADESYKLSDKPLPLQKVPDRPAPLLELGNPLLKTGKIKKGYTLPTGAVLQPSLVLWGELRTAFQTFDRNVTADNEDLSEIAARFDLYGSLNLTATERVFVNFRPLDKNGDFTRYTFNGPGGLEEDTFEDEFNFDFVSLFFEGDFGEIFPLLDPKDKYGLDVSFSVGRQLISWQDGFLLNDRIDSLGLSKLNLKHSWAVNHRATLLWAWNEVNRNSLRSDDNGSSLYGLSNEIDFRESTLQLDLIYVEGSEATGDGFYGGIGAIQRIYDLNTTFRILGSQSSGEQTDQNSDGLLFFTEVSGDLPSSHDFVYLNAFYGVDDFTSASRDPDFGGPLGTTGVLFSAVGLGRYQAALDNDANSVAGGAIGLQSFFNNKRQNVILEIGGRDSRDDTGQRAVAAGLSFQSAVGRRSVIRIDAYSSYGKERALPDLDEDSAFGYGARLEWQLRL